ncbi:MAG: hypothetical protein EGQ67_01470 [Clostridiales bacterium]|nr:hypothetical protein [Clostridiales bacterium]
MERETLEKLYAGLIGMDAGMRLGAPVENPFWTYERLQSYYGDIRGYLREQRYYTADDDVNGPLIFVRALADNAMPETLAQLKKQGCKLAVLSNKYEGGVKDVIPKYLPDLFDVLHGE